MEETSLHTETIGMETEVKDLETILKMYVPIEYWKIFDWETIIEREEEVEENIFRYDLFLYKIYLNEDGIPIEYDNQYIIDDEVYLDLNIDSSQGAGTYHYIGDMPK